MLSQDTFLHNFYNEARGEKFSKFMLFSYRKILPFLDNAPVHPVDVKLSNIALLFFHQILRAKYNHSTKELFVVLKHNSLINV